MPGGTYRVTNNFTKIPALPKNFQPSLGTTVFFTELDLSKESVSEGSGQVGGHASFIYNNSA